MNGLGVRYVALWCLLLGLCQGDNGRWPRNVLCYNDYIKEMRCTWEVRPGDNCSTEYSLVYRQTEGIITNGIVRPYQINSHLLSVPDLCVCNILAEFVAGMQYQINVTYKGLVVLSTSVIPAQTIKPLAPHNLTISSSQGKIQQLMWEDDYTMETFLEKSLRYQVSYKRLRQPHETVNLTNGKRLSLLGYLDGGFTYTLRVRARPTSSYDGIWSNWSNEKEWTEGPEHNLDPIIIPICFGVVFLIVICHFFIKRVKKGYWDKIPVPKLSPSFYKFQEYFFDEKQFESCMVDVLVCSGPRHGTLWGNGPDSCPSIPSVPIFSTFPASSLQLLLPFPHDLKLGPRPPASFFPAFPAMWPGLPTNSDPRAGDQPGGQAKREGYSLFNSLVKPEPEKETEGGEGQWGEEEGWRGREGGEEEEEVIEDRDTPLRLSPYSLGLVEIPSSGYNSFSHVVSAGQGEASDYRPCDRLGMNPTRADTTGPEELWGALETPWPQGPGAFFPVPSPALGGWLEAGARPRAGFGTDPSWREWWPGVSGQMDGKWKGTCLDLGVKGKCHPGTPEGEATPYMKLSLVGIEQSQAYMKLHPTVPQETSYRLTQQ